MASSKCIFRWMFAYSYFAFDNVFLKLKKNVEKIKQKRYKNVKNVTWIKNVKNVYYIYMAYIARVYRRCPSVHCDVDTQTNYRRLCSTQRSSKEIVKQRVGKNSFTRTQKSQSC